MIRRLGKYAVTVTLAIELAGVLIVFTLYNTTDVRLAVVYSGSMEPLMPVGALALLEPVEPADIKAGDIIGYNPVNDPNVTVSHRVVEVLGEGAELEFVTKGDANENRDIYTVPAANVLSLVTHNIPHLGRLMVDVRRQVRSQRGLAIFIVLPTLLLIIFAAMDLRAMYSPRARRTAKLKQRTERRRGRRNLPRSQPALARLLR